MGTFRQEEQTLLRIHIEKNLNCLHAVQRQVIERYERACNELYQLQHLCQHQ